MCCCLLCRTVRESSLRWSSKFQSISWILAGFLYTTGASTNWQWVKISLNLKYIYLICPRHFRQKCLLHAVQKRLTVKHVSWFYPQLYFVNFCPLLGLKFCPQRVDSCTRGIVFHHFPFFLPLTTFHTQLQYLPIFSLPTIHHYNTQTTNHDLDNNQPWF
jgi:hypothetical protein